MNKSKTSADLLQRRDLTNFIRLRNAHPGDDLAVGELLVKTFRDTNAKKMPELATPPEREIELRNVHGRRLNGAVRIIELGYQIIATASLIHPQSALDESWTPNTCTLRCLAVDPRFHSLRLSQKLVLDAIELARKWETDGICLHVQSGAHGVARLYQEFGFSRSEQGDAICMGNAVEGYYLDLNAAIMPIYA